LYKNLAAKFPANLDSFLLGVDFIRRQLETVEMENGNGNSQNLMQMNARVKPLINDHLLKTTSVKIPPLCKDHIKIMSQRLQMTEISCYRDHLYVKTTYQQRLHLPIFKSSRMRACFLIESVLGENSILCYRWSGVK